MGVKCSLLGHDYGESEVERERDEDGDEVIRTAKRVERCRQCGRTRTISENTEVTALEAAAGVVREPDGTVVAATDDAAMTEEIAGNVVIESADGGRAVEGAMSAEETTSTEGAESVEPLATAEPESQTNHAAETVGSSNPSGTGSENHGSTAEEPTETVSIDRIERDSEPQRSTRAPGEWPTDPDDGGAATDSPDAAGSVADGGAAVGRWPGGEATGPGLADDEGAGATTRGKRQSRRPGDTLACGSCRFTSPVADSPLRAGDICPDCGSGYLAWETRKE